MIFLFIAADIFLLDFGIKHYVDTHRKLNEETKILKDKIIIRKYYNNGAALNLLAKRPKVMCGIQTILMAAVSGCFVHFLRLKGHNGIKMALSFLVGGGLSNLFDRYTRHHVVDYFSFGSRWKKLRNVIFNISDLFIFLGAALLILFHRKEHK